MIRLISAESSAAPEMSVALDKPGTTMVAFVRYNFVILKKIWSLTFFPLTCILIFRRVFPDFVLLECLPGVGQ